MGALGKITHNRLGEKYKTNQKYETEIIEYFGATNCTIKFNDERDTILYKVSYARVKVGTVINPYHTSVLGIGYLGQGVYKAKIKGKTTKAYSTWGKVLERCYKEKLRKKYPTYKDVIVCEEWHNFQNFAKWFYKNRIDSFVLDKDIICKHCKIYSPETCAFIPQELNKLFTKRENLRGKYSIGVRKLGDRFQARLSKTDSTAYLGCFDTEIEAFEAYKIAKEEWIQELADKWKPWIKIKIYEAMYNYKVEITD
jgi:hypothetical protein